MNNLDNITIKKNEINKNEELKKQKTIMQNQTKDKQEKKTLETEIYNLSILINKEKEELKNLVKNNITFWHENFKNSKAEEYLKNRGITSNELIDYFNLGYNKEFNCLTICYNNNKDYFIKRTLSENSKLRYFKPLDNEPIFNKEAILESDYIFIVEGQIDSLSILESLLRNENNSFNNGSIKLSNNEKITSIAINGTTGINNLIDYLQTIREKIRTKTFILSFDNDQAGKQAIEKLEELKAKNNLFFNTVEATWTRQDLKDCNDFLIYNEDFEKEILINIYKDKADFLAENSTIKKTERFLNKVNNNEFSFIETPYKKLNEYLGGGLTDGLYTIGAISSLGKTTFCLNLANELARQKNFIYYFTLEQSEEDLISKSLSYLSYKNNEKYALTQQEVMFIKNEKKHIFDKKERYKNFLNCFNDFQTEIAPHLYLYEAIGRITPEIIKKKTLEFIRAMKKKPIIIVDYLQLLKCEEASTNEKEKIDNNLISLKQLSRDLNLAIILISSFNRDSYNKEPSMASFKESGGIEYSSDVMIVLKPLKVAKTEEENIKICKSQPKRNIILNIIKNRRGETNQEIKFIYTASYNHYEEINNEVKKV